MDQSVKLRPTGQTALFAKYQRLFENPPGGLGVIPRPVVLLLDNTMFLRDRVQTVALQMGPERPAEGQRIDHRRVKLRAEMFSDLFPEKTVFKLGIMGHKNRITHKSQKLSQDLRRGRRVLDHLIGNPSQLLDLVWYWPLRPDQPGEGGRHHPVDNLNRSDL